MKWPEQKRIFRKLPGLENAEFFKLGSIHRNTYLNSPKVLDIFHLRKPRVFLADRLVVEGYRESAGMGLIVGRSAMGKLRIRFNHPVDTIIGALTDYVINGGLGLSAMNTILVIATVPKLVCF